ncbi:uncharacterized protein LOC132983629 isoform X2 [Labrus mixtus]|uniref:uncharacterized protein LOC132983629 isoform X2 n=1 Tax=Labrus mixtus TaxID=508554 RepID=UPI0029C09B0C|nr:uncharacterized protein LOC132983629 isoform X2 [Labrus mixtus]
MARTTFKRAIAEVLDNLNKEDYLRFCDQLRDRREEPRVSRTAVEGKRRWEVADVLVSTFTERKAVQVALDLLRQINLNEEAEELDLKTQACADKVDPALHKTLTGELELKPSQEALKGGGPQVKRPKEVEAAAKTLNLSKGGDPCHDLVLLSRCMVLFGKYKGQTFKWLLENDVSYVAYVMAGHQAEKKFTVKQDPLTANKDSLLKYAMAYPEVMEEVRFHCEKAKERSLQPGREGAALVGFGAHRWLTLQDLYESKDSKKIRYVNFLRTMESTCTQGTRMDTAIRYILQRDQEQATAATIRQTTTSIPQEAFKRWTRIYY